MKMYDDKDMINFAMYCLTSCEVKQQDGNSLQSTNASLFRWKEVNSFKIEIRGEKMIEGKDFEILDPYNIKLLTPLFTP